MSRKPRIVVTIHGIQTTGKWQKGITPHLAAHGLVPYHLDYGWFDFLRFLIPYFRNKQIQSIRNELRDLVHHTGVRRVSVIAHSFGTLLAMESLVRENGGLKFDRVVLTGSIVPTDFDWQSNLKQRRVMAVRNERATGDWVVSLAAGVSKHMHWLSRLNAGASGRNGFEQKYPTLIDEAIDGDHSETHNVTKFERWARFMAYPLLPDDILHKMQVEMQAFRQEAAGIMGQEAAQVRINLFAPIDGALRIVPGATDNMLYAPEFELCIEPDHGATGAAFVSGKMALVVKKGEFWSGNHLPGDELAKTHPNLKWVVSLPVRSALRGVVVGVINVDGLDNIPGMLEDQNSEECKAVLLALQGGMIKRVLPCLEAAFLGEELAQVEV